MLLQQRVEREIAEHEFVDRLYLFWDTNYRGALSFQVSNVRFHTVLVWSDQKPTGSRFWSRRSYVQRSHGEHRVVLQSP